MHTKKPPTQAKKGPGVTPRAHLCSEKKEGQNVSHNQATQLNFTSIYALILSDLGPGAGIDFSHSETNQKHGHSRPYNSPKSDL